MIYAVYILINISYKNSGSTNFHFRETFTDNKHQTGQKYNLIAGTEIRCLFLSK